MDMNPLQKGGRRLESRGGIVVSRRHDHLQAGMEVCSLLQKLVVEPLRGRRWVDRVKHIAGDEQRVGLAGGDVLEQPVQKTGVFVVPVVLVERLAEMPVSSVENAHRWAVIFVA